VISRSGKFSLVTAGLAPTLAEAWDTAELRPSEAAGAPEPLALVGRTLRGVWGETADAEPQRPRLYWGRPNDCLRHTQPEADERRLH
jgi:hypothetical protein